MTDDKIEDDTALRELLDREFQRQGIRVAEHLRRFADRIEQLSQQVPYRGAHSRHVQLAVEITAELRAMWGNLTPLEQLLNAASDAQREVDRRLRPAAARVQPEETRQ